MTLWNYALASVGGIATANGYTALYPPSQAIDGSDTSQWRMTGYANWLKIDLGGPQYIDRFRLVQGSEANLYWTSATIAYSANDTDWLNLPTWTLAAGENTLAIDAITARYWRITRLAGGGVGVWLGEWEIIGPIDAPPPPANPVPDIITSWLDGLEANYVPAIQIWLDAH